MFIKKDCYKQQNHNLTSFIFILYTANIIFFENTLLVMLKERDFC